MTQDSHNHFRAKPLWQKEWRSQQHTGPVTKFFTLSDTKIASIGHDSSIKVYRSRDLCPLQSAGATNRSSWAADGHVLSIQGQKRLVVSFHDRSISFYNVLKAEKDPDRPDERSCLGLGGALHAPAATGPFVALSSLPNGSNTTSIEDDRLALGDQNGNVFMLKRSPPTLGRIADLNPEEDLQRLHHHHKSAITHLQHTQHVGLISASLDGSIGVYDPVRGAITAESHIHGRLAVRALDYHEPLSLAISGSAGRNALLWYPHGDPNHAIGELGGHESGAIGIVTAQVGTNEHYVATLSGSGVVRTWDLRTMRVLQSMQSTEDYPSHEDVRPTALLFDKQKQRLYTGTRRPCLWKLQGEDSNEQGAAETTMTVSEANENILKVKSEKSDDLTWKRAHSRLYLGNIDEKQ